MKTFNVQTGHNEVKLMSSRELIDYARAKYSTFVYETFGEDDIDALSFVVNDVESAKECLSTFDYEITNASVYQITYSEGETVVLPEEEVIAEAKAFCSEVFGLNPDHIQTIDDAIEVYENLLHEVIAL
jgi:hypothetical protein